MERTEELTAATAPRAIQQGSYIDWPAILAGAAVAVGVAIVFAEFGAALGLSAVSPEKGQGSGVLGLVFVGLWLAVTSVAAYGAGGYVSGRMRRRMDNATADEVSARDSMHGLVVWALGALVGAWLVATILGTVTAAAGSVVQGAGNAVGGIARATAGVAGAAANSDHGTIAGLNANPVDLINQRLLRGSGVQLDQNATLPKDTMAIFADVARTGTMSDADATYLANALSQNSNLTPDQAKARVDDATKQVLALRDAAQARADKLAQQARDAANAARKAAVASGFALAASLLIAAAAAVWGANTGGRHRDEGRLWAGFRGY